ncbi:sugar phosphate exchanger [Pimephales promelas]|nr:sugar phosphate exchanger [Pimephales promelas]
MSAHDVPVRRPAHSSLSLRVRMGACVVPRLHHSPPPLLPDPRGTLVLPWSLLSGNGARLCIRTGVTPVRMPVSLYRCPPGASVVRMQGWFYRGQGGQKFSTEERRLGASKTIDPGKIHINTGLSDPSETGLRSVTRDSDSQRPLMSDDEDELCEEYSSIQQQEEEPEPQPKAIGFLQAFCLPGVLPYSLAYACLKLVNYSFFFWLPFYLSNNFGWKEVQADRLSVWYDVGGIVGGTVQGLISDLLGKRAPVLVVSLLLAMGALVGYSHSPNDQIVNGALLATTGFLIGGPSNMISSAISADLGRQEALQNSQQALATVTGIVDGTGSIGAAAGQYLVSLIESKFGWMCVFYFFIVMTGCSVLFIIPLLFREMRSLCRDSQARVLSQPPPVYSIHLDDATAATVQRRQWAHHTPAIGGTVQGLISDLLGKRAPVLVVSLLLAMGALVGYSHSPNDQIVNGALLATTGFLIGGPSNMISSAISADLGRQEALQNSQQALATVTGIVDGTGSIGAAAGQYLVSLIESKFGWMCVFYFFIVMTGCSVLFIIPLLFREMRSLCRRQSSSYTSALRSFG